MADQPEEVSAERLAQLFADVDAYQGRALERLGAGVSPEEIYGAEQHPLATATPAEAGAYSREFQRRIEASMMEAAGGPKAWERLNRVGAAISIANKESDRSVAIVMAATVEEHLRGAIERHFAHTAKKVVEKLFNPMQYGAISTFVAKIDLAAALGIIGLKAHAVLKTIASVRNAFAHKLTVASFDDPDVATLVDALTYIDAHLDYREEGMVKVTIKNAANETITQLGHRLDNNPFETRRGRYSQTCYFLNQLLYQSAVGRPEPDLHDQ